MSGGGLNTTVVTRERRTSGKGPGGMSKPSSEKCSACGKRVTRMVVSQGEPYFCSKRCAGLPDRPPGSRPYEYDGLNLPRPLGAGEDGEPSDADLEAES